MKRIFFTLICCLPVWTACTDFLEEESLSVLSTEQYFTNREEAYASVNILYRKGVMAHMRSGSFIGCYYFYPTVYRTGGLIDNTLAKPGSPVVDYIIAWSLNDRYSDGSQTPYMLWSDPYEVIVRNANFALEHLPDCLGLTDAERSQLIAEVRFFRALNYFYLVNTFGPVPLILHSFTSLDGIYVQRSSVKRVYEQILKDLEDSMNALPDRPMPANGFRVSRGSALALAADVCLNMAGYPVLDRSKYAEAARYARLLIESPNYALIQHEAGFNRSDSTSWDHSAYNILRTSDNEREYLFVREYDAVISNAGDQPTWCLPWQASGWMGGYLSIRYMSKHRQTVFPLPAFGCRTQSKNARAGVGIGF